MTRLCVTPGPKLTESLMGFALRLSGVNGFVSPWRLFELTGMRQNEFRTAGVKLDKLAAITGRSLEDLRRVSLRPNSLRHRSWSLLENALRAEELSITNAKFCPLCVMEKGFIEAHWQLALMVGCPEHRRNALTSCTKCKKPISWFRPDLLVCSCRADLFAQEQVQLLSSTVHLLDAVRRKALNDTTAIHWFKTSSIEKMYSFELHLVLTLIRSLGALGKEATGHMRPSAPEELVEGAAAALNDWPNQFHDLLAGIGAGLKHEPDQAQRIYRRLYRKFFKNRELARGKDAQFLRDGFLAFATCTRIDRDVRQLFLKSLPKSRFVRSFTTAREIAANTGVQPTTALRYLEQHPDSICIATRHTRRFLLDRGQLAITRTAPGTILRTREASKYLGIPTPVLTELRRRGIFKVAHHFPTKPGYHESDLELFRDQLLSIRQKSCEQRRATIDLVPLTNVLKNAHDTVATKSQVMKAILSGKIQAFGCEEGNNPGLFLDRHAYKSHVQTLRETSSNGVTARGAARLLHCAPECIPGLMDQGHLVGLKTPTGIRVQRDSIEKFGQVWVSLAATAKAKGTSSRALSRLCEMTGIGLLRIASRPGSSQSFIKAEAQRQLIATLKPLNSCEILMETATQ